MRAFVTYHNRTGMIHLSSGIVVECQDERSQHKNKARTLSILQARLLDQERQVQLTEVAESQRNLVGSGDRSEKTLYPTGL